MAAPAFDRIELNQSDMARIQEMTDKDWALLKRKEGDA